MVWPTAGDNQHHIKAVHFGFFVWRLCHQPLGQIPLCCPLDPGAGLRADGMGGIGQFRSCLDLDKGDNPAPFDDQINLPHRGFEPALKYPVALHLQRQSGQPFGPHTARMGGCTLCRFIRM